MAESKKLSQASSPTRQLAAQRQESQLGTLEKVIERPRLAAHVQLVGEMQESGFKDRQWLIQRDGQFIQVTELLYRVAEQANGKRTLQEIATQLTETTEWVISAEQVALLVQKLLPLGLIAIEDTPNDTRSGGTPQEDRRRSPLALNLRMQVVGPDAINPITRILQYLYLPSVLIPLVIFTAIAHGWLYLVHGVTGSIYEVLYAPGQLLIVLAVILLSAIFHEFGHAAALRYGGGKVRGMGFGLYLIYPAFYTDTTDSYRLGRWARVRTDLGGIYFHLLFALGTIVLYLFTGYSVLPFVVALINLDLIRQFLPFVRLDGYWVLADLTGIPDFFSQIGPFLASVLPVARYEGQKLPELKRWVKVTFALYILLTIPVLAFVAFLAVTRLPRLMAVTLDSFRLQATAFATAWSYSDPLGVIASILQMLILALPALGTVYMLYRFGWRPLTTLWNWSKATLWRRLAGALVIALLVVLMTSLWTQVP